MGIINLQVHHKGSKLHKSTTNNGNLHTINVKTPVTETTGDSSKVTGSVPEDKVQNIINMSVIAKKVGYVFP